MTSTQAMENYKMGLAALLVLVAGVFVVSWLRTPEQRIQLVSAQFGGVSLSLEFATTSAARLQGLGGRLEVPEGYGMLFVFPRDDYYGFWMKDTLVPLDMFWLDDKGQVVYIAKDVQPASYPSVFYPTVPARYVLETAAGFAAAHNIATGTPLLLKKFPSVSK